MSKVLTVVSREYLERVRSKSFVIGTIRLISWTCRMSTPNSSSPMLKLTSWSSSSPDPCFASAA